MPPSRNFYRDYIEWNLKDRRDSQPDDRKGRRDGQTNDEKERVPDIEELFDAAIRHRFGLLISRAARS